MGYFGLLAGYCAIMAVVFLLWDKFPNHKYIPFVFGLGLLCLASYFEWYSAWLLLLAWGFFGISTGMHIARAPETSPMKKSVYMAGFFGFFIFVGSKTLFNTMWLLLSQPSGEHLFHFLTSRSFLGLVVFYLTFLAVILYQRVDELEKQLKL